jgi:hypothetical protein
MEGNEKNGEERKEWRGTKRMEGNEKNGEGMNERIEGEV